MGVALAKAAAVKLAALGWVVACVYLLAAPYAWLAAGVGLAAMVWWLVRAVAHPRSQFFLPVAWRGKGNTGAIALTFDDGPDPEVTPKILALLKAYDAKATFFVLGSRAAEHPALVQHIIAEGHEIGTHTMSHRVRFHVGRAAYIHREIVEAVRVVGEIIGKTPLLFRPPQGLRSPLVADGLRALPQLQCISWTARGRDSLRTTSEAIMRRLRGSLAPGAILVLHDGCGLGGGADRAPTLEALRELLEACRAKALRCETVGSLTGLAPYASDALRAARDPALDRLCFPWRDTLPWPVYALYRTLRALLVLSSFAFFWLGAVLCAWLALPMVWLWPGTRAQKLGRCQRVIRRCFSLFHGYMRVCRLVDVVPLGPLPPPAEPTRGRILVANHTTLIDMTAIIATYPNVICVAKSSYANSALVGRVLRLAGFVAAGTDLHGHHDMLAQCAERLRLGFDVLIFPEGTRSPPGGLQPFHRGAFEIACKNAVEVVHLHMTASPPALSKGLPFWRHPDRVCRLAIRPATVVEPEQFQGNSRAMARAAEAQFREYLALPSVSIVGSRSELR
ncbi:MAG: polysaccharide deacetylase family protein [Myxococcales bacterium]|nr:polysaccharide deacetylase family protein [Myxococcales bacterium]